MAKSLIFSLSFIFLTFTSHAKNATFSECVAYAAEVNKYFPQMVDKVTRVEGVGCLPDNKRVILMYRMNLTFSKQSGSNYSMSKLKKNFIESWCTSPEQRKLLEAVDIRYNYLDKSGSFIDEIDIKLSDCKN